MNKLEVFFFDQLVGYLSQEARELNFVYTDDYLADPKSSAISISLPLVQGAFKGEVIEAFFGGFLPEADIRNSLAKRFGVSEANDFGLLNRIGGDCAGAISVGQTPTQSNRCLVSNEDLAKFFKQIPSRALLSFQETRRMSLAGAQHKLAVLVEDGQIYFPSDKEISTHIIKPAIKEYPDSSHNEYFCMELARSIGLRVPKIKLCFAEKTPYLLINRYDRDQQRRLHQEDFTQALGVSYKFKYQNEGGFGYQECWKLIEANCNDAAKDKQRFLDLLIFNFVIANNDAHAKNFSLLYRDKASSIELAPCYDLLSTGIYEDLSSKMAMKLGKEYNYKRVRPGDWEGLAAELGINAKYLSKRSKKIAQESLKQAESLAAELKPNYPSGVYQKIIKTIKERSKYIF